MKAPKEEQYIAVEKALCSLVNTVCGPLAKKTRVLQERAAGIGRELLDV